MKHFLSLLFCGKKDTNIKGREDENEKKRRRRSTRRGNLIWVSLLFRPALHAFERFSAHSQKSRQKNAKSHVAFFLKRTLQHITTHIKNFCCLFGVIAPFLARQVQYMSGFTEPLSSPACLVLVVVRSRSCMLSSPLCH